MTAWLAHPTTTTRAARIAHSTISDVRAARIAALALTTVALLTLGVPGIARGDADEASLELHGLSGAARLGDPIADTTATVALYGAGLRFTYATSDHFAYEAVLDLATSASALQLDAEYDGNEGDLERVTRVGRLGVGVTTRLGVRFIPTLTLVVGGQARQFAADYLLNSGGQAVASVPSASRFDLFVRAGAGFDYRIDRHFIAGITASVTHALWGPTLDAVEGGLHLSYYWYPRWL